jgi:membrane-bound lytic murein transglycosylase MltF
MKFVVCLSFLALVLRLVLPELAHCAEKEKNPESTLIMRATKPFTGDYPEMCKRNVIRVLVSYSKTNFFVEKGHPKGFEYEMFFEYEKSLNAGLSRKDFKMHVAFVPVAFDELLPALIEGRGDIAAAGLTITPEREKLVAFTDPYLTGVDEIIVTSETAKPLESIQDLAGRKVCVPAASSYAQHLADINKQFRKAGKEPIEIINPSPYFETEDLLELVNAGVFEITVADRHIAELWSSVLADMVLRTDLKVHTGGRIAWAVRKNNPKLLANLNPFVQKNKKRTLIGNILFKRYYENTKWIRNPLTPEDQKKVERYRALFQKYAEKYDFDWLFLAAQSYQESRLDHSTVSRAGAIGLMQVLPSTAKYMDMSNIEDEENNIHSGTKYMAYLRDKFFNDAGMSREAKWDFTLAAYNAGPNRVQRWRKEAANIGLDKNKWFYNVERVALQEIGQETVQYVGNINKYYIAYKSVYRIRREKSEEKPEQQ